MPRILFSFLVLFLSLIGMPGCGGGVSNEVPPPPPPPASTVTQVRIGDESADRVLFFSITIGSPLILTATTGERVLFDIGNNRWELTHTAGKSEPLSAVELTQGTYSSVELLIASPSMVYLDSNGVAQGLVGDLFQTVSVPFSPPLQIGATPRVLSMDVNVGNSLAVDANGFVTGFGFKSSSFTFTSNAIPAEAQQQDQNGEIEDVTGKVIATSGNNFTLKAGQGNSTLTFVTDGTTEFSGDVTSLASALHEIVKVNGFTQPDGTLFARELEGMESETGATLEGLVTDVNAAAGTFWIAIEDGNGSGMDPNKVGFACTVDTNSLTGSGYVVDWGKTDALGLLIPGTQFVFDASHLHAGQRVEVETANPVPGGVGPVVATRVRLQQQAFTGIVSNFVAGSNGEAQFDLVLPNDGSSYMELLLANNVIHVYQQTGTHNPYGTIADLSKVRVRGLLFDSAGYNLIARRITAP